MAERGEEPPGALKLRSLDTGETAAVVCVTLLALAITVIAVSAFRRRKLFPSRLCSGPFRLPLPGGPGVSNGLPPLHPTRSSCLSAVGAQGRERRVSPRACLSRRPPGHRVAAADEETEEDPASSPANKDKTSAEVGDGETDEVVDSRKGSRRTSWRDDPQEIQQWRREGDLLGVGKEECEEDEEERERREDVGEVKGGTLCGSGSFFLVSGSRDRTWKSLTLSFFSSGVGTWILYCPPQLSSLYGMWPVFLYGVAIAAPMWILAYAGPIVREEMKKKMIFGFSDYVRERFGRGMQVVVALVGFFSILVAMAGELAFAAAATRTLSPSFPCLAVVVMIAVVTFVYTALCGTNGSVITDWCQSACLPVLLCIVLVTCLLTARVSREDWAAAALWTQGGAFSGAVMILSCAPAYAMDQGMWQRVLSGRKTGDVRCGLFSGSLLAFGTVSVLGLAGILAAATAHELNRQAEEGGGGHAGVVQVEDFASAPFFFLVLPSLSKGLLGVVLVLAIALAASSVDTFQSALPSLVAAELGAKGLSVGWGLLATLTANVPAVLLAYFWEESIILLFLIGNLLTSAIFPPVFLGLWSTTTTAGSVAGSVAGIVSIFFSGLAFTSGDCGLAARWITLPLGLEHPSALYTFLVVPATSFVTTVVVSVLQRRRRGLQAPASRPPSLNEREDEAAGCRFAFEVPSHSEPGPRPQVAGFSFGGEEVKAVSEQRKVSPAVTTLTGGASTYQLSESVEGRGHP